MINKRVWMFLLLGLFISTFFVSVSAEYGCSCNSCGTNSYLGCFSGGCQYEDQHCKSISDGLSGCVYTAFPSPYTGGVCTDKPIKNITECEVLNDSNVIYTLQNDISIGEWFPEGYCLYIANKDVTLNLNGKNIYRENFSVADSNNTPIQITNCEELQNIKNNLSASYQLANNILCDGTAAWNRGLGFDPIGSNDYDEDCLEKSAIVKTENGAVCTLDQDSGCYQTCQDEMDAGYESVSFTWHEDSSWCEYSSSYEDFDYETCSNFFKGELDGNGFEIIGLNINRPSESNVGLFGYVQNAKISNLKLRNSNIVGYSNVGSIIGSGSGEISNIYVSGTVSGTGGNLGGLVGSGNFKISNSGMRGDILAPKTTTCFSSSGRSSRECNKGSNVGGIIGRAGATLIDYSFFEGTLYNWGTVSGGIAGSGTSGLKISDSYVSANITGYTYTGGLIGAGSYSQINNSYSAGSVTSVYSGGIFSGGYNWYAGGLIGSGEKFSIVNSFSTSNVSVQGMNGYAGGVAGWFRWPKLTNVSFGGTADYFMHATSSVISSDIVNVIDMGATRSRFDHRVPRPEYFKNPPVYSIPDPYSGYYNNETTYPINSWDFDNVWQYNANEYPTLRNNIEDVSYPGKVGGIYINATGVTVKNWDSSSKSGIYGNIFPSIFIANGDSGVLSNINIGQGGLIYLTRGNSKNYDNVLFRDISLNKSGFYAEVMALKDITLDNLISDEGNAWVYVSKNNSLTLSDSNYNDFSAVYNYFGFSGKELTLVSSIENPRAYLKFFNPVFEQDGNGSVAIDFNYVDKSGDTWYNIDSDYFSGLDVESVLSDMDNVLSESSYPRSWLFKIIWLTTSSGDVIQLDGDSVYFSDTYLDPFYYLHFKGVDFCNMNQHCAEGGNCNLNKHRCEYL